MNFPFRHKQIDNPSYSRSVIASFCADRLVSSLSYGPYGLLHNKSSLFLLSCMLEDPTLLLPILCLQTMPVFCHTRYIAKPLSKVFEIFGVLIATQPWLLLPLLLLLLGRLGIDFLFLLWTQANDIEQLGPTFSVGVPQS